MKKLLFLPLLAFALVACNNSKTVETEAEESKTETTEIAETEVLSFYGEKITAENAVPTGDLLAMLEENDSVNIKVEGTINACCQKKGCWMDVDLGNGQSMIVKFKDYEFFVPKNASGQTAIMEGKAKVEVQTVEWLRHKAKDANMSEEEIAAITEEEMSVTFLANGVIIKGDIPPMEEAEEVENSDESVTAE